MMGLVQFWIMLTVYFPLVVALSPGGIEQADGSVKAMCNVCGHKYSYDSHRGGTSTLSRHKCPRREMQDVGQMLSVNGKMSTSARKIDQMKFQELARNLPSSLVELPEFRELSLVCLSE
ncbi:hypothetical protein C5167_044028 [Papaver somniferum]|uniref:BED-type domain-containing protein n=1 Tax=Papaver somniferum TaxID=3469 RepID=A0A4Y7L9Y2_PAPSO|nr:hypothetical protein C5167_044028 [Papaver somniferum]